MLAKPIHELPIGYNEIRHVELTDEKLLLRLNILAILPLLAMIVWMAIWWGIASSGRTFSDGFSLPWWLTVIIVMIAVLPLHELIHGIVIMLFGYRVRYGAKLSKGVLYATTDNALFRRDQYLAVALAPFVVITLAAMAIMRIAPQWVAYVASLAAVLNAGGAVGDLWAVGVIARYPAQLLVRDEEDGFRLYAPVSADGSSIQNSEPPSGI
jgi:hypothetical protein